MKKYAILAFLIAAPAYGHIVEPETQFFKDELNKNPEIAQVLQYCKLRGFMNEETCKAEFYDASGISPLKMEAAAKCLDKSGYKYRAALDSFFKVDAQKATLVSHEVLGGFWHTYYLNDPKDTKGTPKHRHDWSEPTRQLAGDRAGIEAVKSFKERMTREGKTFTGTKTVTSTVTAGGGAVPASAGGSFSQGGSTTTTPSVYTQKEVDEAYKAGFASGHSNPGNWGLKPDVACWEKGLCEDNAHGGSFSNPDYDKDKGVAKESKDPKPEAPKEEPKEEETKDPFAPFSSPSDSSGGVKTSEETKAEEKVAEDKKSGITTPVDDPQFYLQWDDCANTEEQKLLKEVGSKTKDQDAKEDEEKKREAEEMLAQGVCDLEYYGAQFCHDFKNAHSKTEDEGAEAKRKEEYEQAMEEFKNGGACNERTLGWEFCKAAKDELESNKVTKEPWEEATLSSPQPPTETPIDNGWPDEGLGFGPVESGTSPEPMSDCERDIFGECKL